MSERLRLPGSARRGPCPTCRRDVAMKNDGTPYGHKHIPQHDWDCYVSFRAGRKCKHGDKQASDIEAEPERA